MEVAALCPDCGATSQVETCGECGSGILLGGRFVLEREIGAGAAGITYRGRDDLGMPVAIKRFDLSRARDPKQLALIERECAVLRQLRHPRIPRYVAHFVIGTGLRKRLFLVQGFVDGKNLDGWMEEHRFTEAEILDVVEKILDVLDYLHHLSPPVLHRDIKPKNVIREAATGELFLVDFGSVQDELKGDLGGSTVAGTFGYMAPEQFGGDASPASDLYGLGALAIHLATRRDPQKMLDHSNRLQWKEHAGVSAATRRFLDRMVAPDLGERFRDVASARAELERARRGEGVVAPVARVADFVLPPASPVTWVNSRPLAKIDSGPSTGPQWRVRRPRTGEERELSLEAIWAGHQNGWLEPTDTVGADRAEALFGGLALAQFAVKVFGEEGGTLFDAARRAQDFRKNRTRRAVVAFCVLMVMVMVPLLRAAEMIWHPAVETPSHETPAHQRATSPIPTHSSMPAWPYDAAGEPVVTATTITCEMRLIIGVAGNAGFMELPSSVGAECVDPFSRAALQAATLWTFEPATKNGVPTEGPYRFTFRFEPNGSTAIGPTP